jgi:septal ring factor EnvC (AmiA/AmiB activator)
MHFGISAPRMMVRTALPWWERGAALAAVVATVVGVSWWVLSASPSTAASRAADESRLSAGSEASRLRDDIGRLRVQSSQLESDLMMSRSAQEALSRQVAELTAENAKLKEHATMLRKLLAEASPSSLKGASPGQRP